MVTSCFPSLAFKISSLCRSYMLKPILTQKLQMLGFGCCCWGSCCCCCNYYCYYYFLLLQFFPFVSICTRTTIVLFLLLLLLRLLVVVLLQFLVAVLLLAIFCFTIINISTFSHTFSITITTTSSISTATTTTTTAATTTATTSISCDGHGRINLRCYTSIRTSVKTSDVWSIFASVMRCQNLVDGLEISKRDTWSKVYVRLFFDSMFVGDISNPCRPRQNLDVINSLPLDSHRSCTQFTVHSSCTTSHSSCKDGLVEI